MGGSLDSQAWTLLGRLAAVHLPATAACPFCGSEPMVYGETVMLIHFGMCLRELARQLIGEREKLAARAT